MQEITERTLIRCETTHVPLFRKDPQKRGIWIWCKGHHKEELKTWEELGIPKEAPTSLQAE